MGDTGAFGSQCSPRRTAVFELTLGVLDAAVLELALCGLDADFIFIFLVLELAHRALDTDLRFAPFSRTRKFRFSNFASVLPFQLPRFVKLFTSLPLLIHHPFSYLLPGPCRICTKTVFGFVRGRVGFSTGG